MGTACSSEASCCSTYPAASFPASDLLRFKPGAVFGVPAVDATGLLARVAAVYAGVDYSIAKIPPVPCALACVAFLPYAVALPDAADLMLDAGVCGFGAEAEENEASWRAASAAVADDDDDAARDYCCNCG